MSIIGGKVATCSPQLAVCPRPIRKPGQGAHAPKDQRHAEQLLQHCLHGAWELSGSMELEKSKIKKRTEGKSGDQM